MFKQNIIFVAALVLLAAAAGRLIYRRATFSPQFISICALLFMGGLALIPQMKYSANREYEFSLPMQLFVLAVATIVLLTTLFMRRPRLRGSYAPVRWRLVPCRAWLLLFLAICLADPLTSYLIYGKVGLVQGNQGMGTGGGAHSEVFTPLTFIAWSSASMAMAMLLTDFLFSFESMSSFLRRRLFDVGVVALCSLSTTLSGNRFILISQLLSILLGLALFSRLKVWLLPVVAIVVGFFFVVVGNFRFGVMNVTDSLQKTTGINSVDMLTAWVVTYSEPTFPNLDNFMRDQPDYTWGKDWLSSLLPSGLCDALGLGRMNSASWLKDNNLYAYHGLTFRTMFPDLIMDFTAAGALLITLLFCTLGVIAYNRALVSPRAFLFFLLYAPLVLLMPLLTGFYQLPNLTVFALLLLCKPQPRPAALRRVPAPESIPTPAAA